MTVSKWPGFKRQRGPREVWSEWTAADESGEAERAAILAAEMLQMAPGSFDAWFHAGLLSKALGEWGQSMERNARALELFTPEAAEEFDGVNPAAWNLGIAATALGDWATARRAWEAYGVQGIGGGSGPIDSDFGVVPIRLNPDQPSLPHQVPPSAGATEVVWCWRRSPAHAVIANVPLPESRHRFKDVVLHDGEPKGFRRLGAQAVPVFDQLQRLEDSGLPTWEARITGAAPDDIRELSSHLEQRGLGLDDWSGIRVMCSQCSHGTPDHAHHHEPAPSDVARLGLAGHEGELNRILEAWMGSRPAVDLDLTLLG
ncbi:tetratricopeptide repeat protein [Pseudarthrobacter sp. NS4]|uniref:tetratricopeptide repeat protein n=1 Tax=Pseudarthrobacter sp. NS4 TaxID=2973976 RepID=UPI0021617E1A|nr:tetratricopeptide repeat protein [Pseudarthrobacter sp. NS4]